MTKPTLRLKALRKQRKLTQMRLSEAVEAAGATLSQGNISDMENGNMNPTLETLGSLAAALECEPHELFASFEKHAGAVVLFHIMEELSDVERDAVIAVAESFKARHQAA